MITLSGWIRSRIVRLLSKHHSSFASPTYQLPQLPSGDRKPAGLSAGDSDVAPGKSAFEASHTPIPNVDEA
jgi:hypothetical protein